MSEENLLELCGSVEQIIFRNENNGYTVMSMLCDGEEATAVGSVTDVNIGDELKLIGVWKQHSSYGEQFALSAMSNLCRQPQKVYLNIFLRAR